MPQIYGKTAKTLPTAVADASQLQPRLDSYGDTQTVQLMDNHSSLADEGSYFKAVTQTPGTTTTATIITSFSATSAFFTIANTSASGGKRIFLDYMRLMNVVVPASATSCQCAITIDTGTRYASGGTAVTPVNANMDSSRATVASMFIGAVTLSAATGSVRTVVRHNPKQAILVAGDVISIDFGEHSSSSAPLTGAAAQVYPASVGPVVIGGGQSVNFHLWFPGNAVTAATFEYDIAWWER